MTLDECEDYYKETGCVDYDACHNGNYIKATLTFNGIDSEWIIEPENPYLNLREIIDDIEWSVW